MVENAVKLNFRKELSWIEIEGVVSYINKYFKENYRIDDAWYKFGLPYTSSGEFILLANTNCTFEIDEGIYLVFFTLTENNQIIAIGEDRENNYYYYWLW